MSRPVTLPPALKPYRVSSAFGVQREYPKGSGKYTPKHNGCDWATPVGLPLTSGIVGKVTLMGGGPNHIWGYYVHIMCDCPQRHTQEFHILRELPSWLREGTRVGIGTLIGYTGRSGSLNGQPYQPHHHHGTSENGQFYNPLIIGWPSAAGGSTPLEDEMTPEQAGMLKFLYDAHLKGGPDMPDKGRSIGQSLAGIVAVVDQIKANVTETVQRTDTNGKPYRVTQIQELADAKTVAMEVRTLVQQLIANPTEPGTGPASITEADLDAIAEKVAGLITSTRLTIE